MPARTAAGTKVRAPEEVKGVPRSGALSLWRTAKEEVVERMPAAAAMEGPPKPPRMRDRVAFFSKSVLKWVVKFVSTLFKRTRPYRTYEAPATGMFVMPDRVSIALASDWGTGTASAYAVGDAIRAVNPDITIHMGDVYYSGTREEYRDYFLDEPAWPHGSLVASSASDAAGTYALNANHEMYSGGEGYFEEALPALKQTASYFCLHNAHWRVVALDTGYHTTRGVMIVFKNDTKLHKANIEWLEKTVFADSGDRRPVILLSHHQWFSAFDKHEYRKVGDALLPYLDRVALWFWGHEHRLAGYAPFGLRGGVVRARCIGHGGMPVDVARKVERTDRPVVFHDEREAEIVDGERVGFCGFAHVRLEGPECVVEYIDEKQTVLLREQWVHREGRLTGTLVKTPASSFLAWHRPETDLVR
jgi:3',5'-cyclic AMP phosphodiesterase CpdA